MKGRALLVSGCLVIGMLAGYVLGRPGGVAWRARGLTQPARVEPDALGQTARQSTGLEPQAVRAQELVRLAEFESTSDLAKWEVKSAELELSTRYPTAGRHSVKATFYSGQDMASMVLSKAFRAKQLPVDWTPYRQLTVDVFNPQERPERLIVQVKDEAGKRCKQSFTLPATSATPIALHTGVCQGMIDLRHVEAIQVFLWKPKKDVTLYLDTLRLVPRSSSEDDAVSPAQAREAAEALETVRQGIVSAERLTAERFRQRIDAWSVPGSGIVRVPLRVQETAGVARDRWLVTGGIPMPPGQLTALSQARVVNQRGHPQEAQLSPLATWQDGSVKWLLVRTPLTLQPSEAKALFLEYGSVQPVPSTSSLVVQEDDRAIAVVTGPLRVTVSKQAFTLLEGAWLDRNQDGQFTDEERIGLPGNFSMARGEITYDSRRDTQTYRVVVEEQGPLAVTLKASGWFRDAHGHAFGQFIVRIQAFAGQRYVRLYPTFIYTGYPANLYHFKYEGLALPDNEPVDEIALEIPLAVAAAPSCRFEDQGGVFEGTVTDHLTLYQQTHEAYALDGAGSHVPPSGRQLSGWVDVSDEDRGVTVVVRDFWQQFPKAFRLDPQHQRLTVALWPREAGPLDLQTTKEAYGPDAVARGSAFGLGKTHELVMEFHEGTVTDAARRRLNAAVQEPVQMRATAAWVNDTGVLGRLAPAEDTRQLDDEQFLERLFNWATRQKDRFAWYGMLNFGDTLSWYRREAYDKSYPDWGWHPEGRWGWFNCEGVGTHTGALLQYLRTGQWSYFQFGEDLARHVMDVDTVHYNTIANDPRLNALIDDEYSRVGSMHRHNANHWGDRNEEASHTSVVGLLLYYYLTGYPRAHDVALEVGDFFLGEHMTYSGHPDIAPQRTLANVLWGDTVLYAFTHEEAYLQGAAKWARVLVEGQHEDGHWTETYDPLTRAWGGKENHSYTTNYTLPALIAYHQLTNQPEVGEAIVRSTRYLMQHERYLSLFDALAYSFDLTGDEQFLREGQQRLAAVIQAQDRSGDPLRDGMVYDKLTYGRVVSFLYSTPFFFDVLEHPAASRMDR